MSDKEIPVSNDVTSIDLDSILNEHFAGEVFEKNSWKNVDAKKVIESLPEDGKKLVQNLRSDYTRKTTELAKQKRELEEREQQILSSSLETLRSKMNIPDDIDLYSENGLEQYVQAKVAKALHEQQAPIKEQYEEARRRDELIKFKSEHPDMDSLKEDMLSSLHSGEAIDVRAAYWVAKGKLAEKEAQSSALLQKEAKKEQRAAGMKVGIGAPVNVKSNAPRTAREAYEILKAQGKA